MQMYNDVPQPAEAAQMVAVAQSEQSEEQEDKSKIPQPEISIIVDGKNIFKPGMKSVFIEADDSVTVGDRKQLVGGVYCSCNTVCTCQSVTVCSCQGVCGCNSQCSCNSHSAQGCSCAPVH